MSWPDLPFPPAAIVIRAGAMHNPLSEIAEFEKFLEIVGLECVRREAPENAMGCRRIEYVGPELCVLLIFDKGWDLCLAEANRSPTLWYHLESFAFVVDGEADPQMSFVEQLAYARENWSEIRAAFKPSRRTRSHFLLNAASIHRREVIFHISPTAVLEFGSFLEQQDLNCLYKKLPSFASDSLSFLYGDSRISIRADSEGQWRVYLADPTHAPWRWFDVATVARAIDSPDAKPLGYIQIFKFIETNWPKISTMFCGADWESVHRTLELVEHDPTR